MTARRSALRSALRESQLNVSSSAPSQIYQTQPLAVRIPEACRISGIGRSKLYELIKAHEIAIIKVGTITLIPLDDLKTFLGIGAGNHS